MDPALLKLATAAKAAAGSIWKWLKPLRAEKQAAEAPEKVKTVDQSTFDDVLRRMAASEPSDSIFTRSYGAVTNKFFTPDFLRSTSVQVWLQEPGVRQDLRDVASTMVLGFEASHEAVARLEARYREVASASSQESSPVVAAICAMLVAGVNSRVQDKGTAVVVAAVAMESARRFDGMEAKLDTFLANSPHPPTAQGAAKPLDTVTMTAWREAFRTASRGLLHWPTTLGDGEHIARPELEQLLETISSKRRGTLALLGLPGSGKSALLSRLGQALAATPSVAVLAIKGDLLDAGVASEEDLQRDLQLPELPSVMLRRLASAGPVVLLIDQLDALAGHLDTKTGRLGALLNLVKSLSQVDGLHVFVSCRSFEFSHDIRLSRIDAESLTLELPPWERVLTILESRGVRAGGWNSDAREVLRVPQQLSIYLQLRSSGIDEPVSNYTAMLETLWNMRVLSAPGGAGAAKVAFEIAEQMADRETLWLAGARFDDKAEDVKLLVSMGILTTSEQGAIGFSHQTVFEHVLARNFAKHDGRLSAYVIARTESLFVRPKLWAALGYLRGVEPETYELELSTIWSAPELRKHLRFLLIDFLGSQPKPSDKEELLLAAACEQHELLPIVLKAITGSQGWFERFGSNVIARSMSDEKTADHCVHLLASAFMHSAEKVETLLREVWLPVPDNDRRALFVLQDAPSWTPALIQVAKTIAARVELAALHIDHFVAAVGGTDPVIAIQLLRIFLDGELSRRKAEALRLRAIAERDKPTGSDSDIGWHLEHNPLRPIDGLLDDSQRGNSVLELAAASPAQFVEVLWPWYVRAFRDLLELSTGSEQYFRYPLPYGADFRFEGEDRNKLPPSSVLEAIAVAVEQWGAVAPQDLVRWTLGQAHIELVPVQRLVAYGLTTNPSQTASAALDFLLSDERRYFLGGATDSSSTTLALIAACAPFWSAEELALFTSKVKSFSPTRPAEKDTPEGIRWWHRYIRRTRVNLLRALPPHTRSRDVQRELDEANRALPHRSADADFTGGWIGSPMEATQFALASNEDILNAFKRIPDQSGWDHPRYFGRGGNVQLARAFADFSKDNAARALEVIALLAPDFGQRAAGYALDALAQKHDARELMELMVDLHVRGFSDEEFKGSVAQAVDRLLRRDVIISDHVLEILEGWVFANIAESPSNNSASEKEEELNTERGYLLSGHPRVEMVPGGDYPILSAIVQARFARKEVLTVIRLLRRYLGVSQDKRIWEGLTHHLAAIPYEDSHEGPDLVAEVLSLSQLDGSRGAASLMARTHLKAPEAVMPNLGRWRDSKNVSAQIGYGELVVLISLTNRQSPEAQQWLDELVENPRFTNARTGAAATAVQIFWPELRFRASATDLLLRLLSKNEVDVWGEIFGLFALVDRLEPEPHTVRLLEEIADKIVFAPAPKEPYVVERLGTLLPRHADIVARIASHLIQLWRDQLATMGSALVSAGQEMMDLAVTLHRTQGTKLEGLQMFEQLIEIDAYQAREMLDEIDHRVRVGALPSRPRLPRRARRRAGRTR